MAGAVPGRGISRKVFVFGFNEHVAPHELRMLQATLHKAEHASWLKGPSTLFDDPAPIGLPGRSEGSGLAYALRRAASAAGKRVVASIAHVRRPQSRGCPTFH